VISCSRIFFKGIFMYRTNNLNYGSGSAAHILSRLPMRGAITTQQNDEPAEVSPQSSVITDKGSREVGQAVQSSADTRSVFANPGQGRLAEAMIEILDSPPQMIRKPLSLIEEHAYAVTWLYAKSQESVQNGYKASSVTNVTSSELRQFIVSDDGEVFGDGFKDCTKSGLEVHLSEMPKLDKLFSKSGFIGFLDGERPEAVDVYNRVVHTIDRFMDFNHSLADQQIMCELIGCYVLATWFLDAFNVIGFLWPNGVRGSGKTQLLNVVAELSYLGEMILTGSTFASMRDLADYGATLAFDDSENVANPRMDPDKRALLLAGNRRGNAIAVKESIGQNKWKTRRVNTFCPRLFSAIQLPDEVLASRTIVIPLIRSSNPHKANANPSDYGLWPHDRRKLVDDLWALSLSQLPIMSSYETKAIKLARLSGRDLEPWLALLAVAAWLTDRGLAGLWERIEKVSYKYQKERQHLESDSMTALVVRALYRCVDRDIGDTYDASTGEREWFLRTADVARAVRRIAQESEVNINVVSITPVSVGLELGTMRFRRKRTSTTRGWLITWDELQHWASTLNITTL
jgi:hypothetical protein